MLELQLRHRPFLRWRRETISGPALGRIALSISMLSGATFSAFGKTLGTVFAPLSLVFVSEALSLVFQCMSFGAIPTLQKLAALKRQKYLPLFAVGLFSGVIGPLLLFTGLSYTTAVNTVLFSRTDVIFMIALAHFVLREKLAKEHYAAIGFVSFGTLIIVLQGFTAGVSLHAGDVIIIFASLSYALGSIVFRKYLSDIEPHLALFTRSIMAITAFFLLSPFIEHPFITEVLSAPMTLLPTLLGFAFLSRFLNSVMYYEAIDHLPVSSVTIIGSMDIVLGALFAHWYLGEPLAWYHLLGAASMLMGNLLLAVFHTPTTAQPATTTIRHRP